MDYVNFQKIGLLVGIEIHQQLLTSKKLFCNCNNCDDNNTKKIILRKLRISKGELGRYDQSTLFEKTKFKTILYSATKNSCLVEEDEEPPHNLNTNAKYIALIIATNLNSNIFTEAYVMRKTVIDGSNTSGFQRSILISSGGQIKINNKNVQIQTICLEEDSARLVKDKKNIKEYNLDRLGVPLIEIALSPICASPFEIRKIAFEIGMFLRATKKVKRGLGTIRQDVNISIKGGNVVEIKGIQNLDQLEKAINYEIKRQTGLLKIIKILKEKGVHKISINDVYDITEFARKSTEIKDVFKNNYSSIKLIKLKNFSGVLCYEYNHNMTLSKELTRIIKFFDINWILQSDKIQDNEEHENYIKQIKTEFEINYNDVFIIISGKKPNIMTAIEYLIKRINTAMITIPAETRIAMQDGETLFMRPKSGSDRMYPETDLPPIITTKKEILIAKNYKLRTWKESIAYIKKKYNLNSQLAEQIFDSEYLELFKNVCVNKKLIPSFVASSLCSTITKLHRDGLNLTNLKITEIVNTFILLSENKITKESVEIIFRGLMSQKLKTAMEYVQNISKINEEQLNIMLDKLIKNNIDFVYNEKQRSINKLMGKIMNELRGKVNGKKINRLLQKKISAALQNKNN